MKKLFLTAALACACLAGYAQVYGTVAGASLTVGTGIGTQSPRGNIEIFPVCNSTGSFPNLLLSRPGTLACSFGNSFGNYLEVREYNVNNTTFTMPFMVGGNGRIGVNTATPLVKLDLYTSVMNDGIRITQTNAHGAVLGLYNTTSGGHNWALFSTGNGNTQGSGNFMLYDYTVNQSRFFIQGTNGYIGVSTTSPSAMLDLNATGGHKGINITADRPDWSYGIHYQHQSANRFCKAFAISKQGQDVFVVHSGGSTAINHSTTSDWETALAVNINRDYTKAFSINSSITGTTLFTVWGNGVVNAKKIYAEEIFVTPGAIGMYWPDYVFRPGYRLRPLSEVERFYTEHNHLPDVPSEQEVQQGVAVGEMTTILLRKIEELTLYIVAQQKEIDALKAQVNQTNH